MRRVGTIVFVLVVVLLLPLERVRAATPSGKYPRLANYYLNPTLTPEIADQLSKWDLLILDMEISYTTPDLLKHIRERNPDIIILAYVTSQEIALRRGSMADHNDPYYQLYTSIPEGWWLHDHLGNHVTFFPGTEMLNVTNQAEVVNGQRWNTFLPQFMHDHVLSSGLWNGIYFDNTWNTISWLNHGDLDANSDGTTDLSSAIDIAWRDGMRTMLAKSRTLEGNNAIIVGNGDGQYFSSLNGRLMEEFPNPENGTWAGATQIYFDIMAQAKKPAYVVINGKSKTQQQDDYQSMRYTLTSGLLNNGYVSFDAGIILDHVQLWWYDVYNTYLGPPVSTAKNLSSTSSLVKTGLWRRDFRDGIVFTNSTDKTQSVNLLDGYELVNMTRSASLTPTSIVTTLTLPAHDGAILLKRQFSIDQGEYYNGAFTRSFSQTGKASRQGFFAYNEKFAGGAPIVKRDLDHTGTFETVYGENGIVYVLNDRGQRIASFAPYGTHYHGALNIAVGDLNGDGSSEIVTGTGEGGGPQVRIFSELGKALSPGFFAYPSSLRGGVSVAVGDVNGDGKAEIVTGAGRGGEPQVRVFDGNGKPTGTNFFAYSQAFHGGVSVAVGDVNGDGKAEIVTGAGRGGGPQVRVFDGNGKPTGTSFFAFEQSFRGGINVGVTDLNFDHQNDILVSTPTLY